MQNIIYAVVWTDNAFGHLTLQGETALNVINSAKSMHSNGADKIHNLRAVKVTVDDKLETLWQPVDIDKLDEFTRAYMECALWSSTYEDHSCAVTLNMDENFTITNIAPATFGQMIADCASFQLEYSAALKNAYNSGVTNRDGEEYNTSNAGHDFWLTRCGHGAGFWDRGLGADGEVLSEACGFRTKYDNIDLYIGDDNLIHA